MPPPDTREILENPPENRPGTVRPLPNILKIVFLKVVAAFEMLDSLGFMAPIPNIRSQDFV